MNGTAPRRCAANAGAISGDTAPIDAKQKAGRYPGLLPSLSLAANPSVVSIGE